MFEKSITTSDGVTRTVRGKVFPDVVRVYAIHGDISDTDALAELAQVLSIEFNAQRVELSR